MKPVSVKFKCFGPYMDEQFIVFSELEKNGLFLICGETGAGKTTILDAICYALYCESSGGQRGDIENMRCKLAEKGDETAVEFIFDSAGWRYKFSRSMKYKTKNLHKYHNCYVLKDGAWEVLETGMSQVSACARRLVGLTSSQFRQVIILPQGKFEEFLVSDSDKKEEILVTLFNVQQWSRISAEISRRVTARAAELNQEKSAIDHGLARYGCKDLENLETLRLRLEQEREEKIPQAEAAAAAEKEARETLHTQQQVAKDYAELRKRQKNYDSLLGQESGIRSLEESLSLADRAEQIREPYEAFRNARREFNKAEETVRRNEKRVSDAQSALDAARRNLESHMTREKAMEEKKAELLRLENAKPVYEQLGDLQRAEAAAGQKAAGLRAVYREKETALEQMERDLAAAFDAQEQAKVAHSQGQERYRRGIGGILAATLEAGRRCPVCGSLEHPDPAKPDADTISEAQLDKLSKAMNRADREVAAAIKARSRGEKEKNQAQKSLSEAEQAFVLAQADCRSAEARKIPGIETAQVLARTVTSLKREIQTWEEFGKNLLDAKTAAQGSFRAAELAREEAQAGFLTAQNAYSGQSALWKTSCTAGGFTSEEEFLEACLEPREKQRRRERAAAYRSDLKVAAAALDEQKLAVEGKPLQDIPALEKALSLAEEEKNSLNKQKILLESRIKQLLADQKDLAARQEKNREALICLEADQVFARRIAGSNGVGLQRYVLGVMMNSITTQANLLLNNVYGGRYRLHRTDEASGGTRKSGLELEVFDSHNSQRRSVRTLSGGEKFLVALSLAIGLSTVVQAQGEGIRLEAMFIDEGFGSLDREAIHDALDILQGIRGSAGVVGIISHVDALAEAIPARIEITKGKRGSKASVLGA